MPLHVLLLACTAIIIIGLSGLRETLVTIREQIPLLPHMPAETQGSDPVPGTVETIPPRPGAASRVQSYYTRSLDEMAAPGLNGLILTSALVILALATSAIALLIELDDLPTILICSTALLALAASGVVLKTRYDRKSWFTRPMESVRSDAIQSLSCGSPAPGSSPVPPSLPDPAASPDTTGDSAIEMYWVVEPFSSVRIERTESGCFRYHVSEPVVSQKEKTILRETHARLRDVIIFDDSEEGREPRIDPVVVEKIIRQFDPAIPVERIRILNYYIRRDLSGYGPLEVLMRDPALEDISCNGHGLPVFVFHRAYGSLPTNVFFSESELNQFVLKLAQKANKQISLSNPLADATLPDGARIQITYSGVVSLRGSSFTIRKFRAEPMTPLDLIRFGTFSAETMAFLWLCIEHRKSLLVVGGTASGKTSMMNAVSLFIPQNAKIVSLEDTHEIQLPHKNWLPTLTRELNSEGIKGDIDLFSLLKACMRQRPEFIIVGEVRGREAQTLFQAMNSGHATLSTIHAGSVYEAVNRLTHDPINVPSVMFQALDLVVVQSIYTLGKRRIRRNMSIHEIEVTRSGEIIPRLLFEWDVHTDTFRKVSETSRVLEEIAFHCGWDNEELSRQLKRREEFFAAAMEMKDATIYDLANAIQDLGE